MRYKIKKETKPTLQTYGKYKDVAVHNQVIESRQLYEEACRGTSLSAGYIREMYTEVYSAHALGAEISAIGGTFCISFMQLFTLTYISVLSSAN